MVPMCGVYAFTGVKTMVYQFWHMKGCVERLSNVTWFTQLQGGKARR